MKTVHPFIFMLCMLMVFAACNEVDSDALKSKPVALGKRNRITVIADKGIWNGSIQDSFYYYFAAAYPIMPQPEPIFDIRHFTVNDLSKEPLRRNLRTYVILCDLSDKSSSTTKMLLKDLGEKKFNEALNGKGSTVSAGVDKWANKQLIIYLYGKDEAALAQSIKDNFAKVAKRINQHDQDQLKANTYALKKHQVYSKDVTMRYGIKLDIPGDYKEAMYDTVRNVTWYRKDTKTAFLNLAIQKEKYTSEKQFSKDYIVKKRDQFGKRYVSSSTEGSYMVSNTEDLPVYEYRRNYGNMVTKEIRGIWEMENDFIGGPYISYALYNESKGEIIYIDCFVMNIGKDKRDLMQEMEYIVKSLEGS